jgi:hypothetical protein
LNLEKGKDLRRYLNQQPRGNCMRGGYLVNIAPL